MSDAPEHETTSAAPEAPPVPEDLASVASPAHVRRAPRFGSFIGTGVGAGIVVAMILAIVLPNSTGTGRFLVFVLLALGFGLVGALVGGALATGLDRTRSAR
ncbi:hypothetical protein [Demequina sp.]|uniref:hypothetical protein n=1 Tax=Demequina sp. TaxID=2050685 RepID=UPI0025EA7BB4|nr:hypothetical protein [Demequina sp.]